MMNKETQSKGSIKYKFLIGLSAVVLIVLMFPKGESIESEVTVGSIWMHEDLIAPFSFPILKDEKTYQTESRKAANSVYPVYLKQPETIDVIIDSVKKYDLFLIRILDSTLSTVGVENLNPTFLSTPSFNTFQNLRRQERNMLQNKNLKDIFGNLNGMLVDVYKNGIIDQLPEGGKDSIAVRTGNVDKIEPVNKFLDVKSADDIVLNEIGQMGYALDLQNALDEYTGHFVKPNIIYNQQATQEEIDQAKSNVSRYIGIVNENERIIAKHDRITREAKLKIDSYKAAKGEKTGESGYWLQFVGKFFHIALIISLLSIYLYLFRKKIFYDNQKILLITIIFIFVCFITFLINQIAIDAPLQFLIFIPAATMLLTIIFDSRVGFYSTVIISLITGALRGNDYTFAAMNIFAGALAVYTVRDIKNRSQIFRSFLFILLGYLIAVFAFGLESFASIESLTIEMAFASTNALISPVLTYGLLIFFERFFRITTDLTLLELSNFDRPLLKELARKAPGTFNHSMTMGTLAETAAEKIRANPLLARVGAYYHDVGKIITPQNFVENQLNNQNVHENLTPEESIELISRHVKEGIELAREYNIPQEIIDFIPMHHGTMVMSFFYEKAKKLYGEEKVNIDEYRYPGPKPNSKETAIIMLADGCESAVRSIENPEPVKVENVIDKIIRNRIDDGQLDNSPITFSDIDRIKEAFISILLGQHHRRIRYPKQEEMEQGEPGKKEE
ncbi:MAG TPA: HDIG domain-containing protein [Ignavibacteriaceae bacterium]|nr:HDIG domain-containing protein [Ignavibacteriaceae bacterium]